MEHPIRAVYTAREDGDYDFLMALDLERIWKSLEDCLEETDENPGDVLIQHVLEDLKQQGVSAAAIPFEDLSHLTDVYCGEPPEDGKNCYNIRTNKEN